MKWSLIFVCTCMKLYGNRLLYQFDISSKMISSSLIDETVSDVDRTTKVFPPMIMLEDK